MNNNQKTESEKLPVFKSIEELVGQCKIHPDMPFEERSDFNISPNKSYRCVGCGKDEFEFTTNTAFKNLDKVRKLKKDYFSQEDVEIILERSTKGRKDYKEIFLKCKKTPMSPERRAELIKSLEQQPKAYGCPNCGIVLGDYKRSFSGVLIDSEDPFTYSKHINLYCMNCDGYLGRTYEKSSMRPIPVGEGSLG